MTIRTPRRRISPRTKRRYRAIKQFFRKALSSVSQPDINVLNSNRTDDVLDLKHKIIGLEQQLSEVSRHCRDIISSSRRGSQSHFSYEPRSVDNLSERHLTDVELIYKTSGTLYNRSEANGSIPSENNESNIIYPTNRIDTKKKSTENTTVNNTDMASNHHHKTTKPFCLTIGSHSASSVLTDDCYVEKVRRCRNNQRTRHCIRDDDVTNEDQMQRANLENFERYYHEIPKRHRVNKHQINKNVDQDFIADIIKKQYRPLKMFGKRDSDLSQVSAPICRDHELTANVQDDWELCSSCYGSQHHARVYHDHHNEHNDAKSICDTRLYSCQKHPNIKRIQIRKKYDDTELYDLVPVKEKSSPKSRRKFVQDNDMYCNYYKEVPPSPKTHRPRLNLKAQYYSEAEEHGYFKGEVRKRTPKMYKKKTVQDGFDSDTHSELVSRSQISTHGKSQILRIAKVCNQIKEEAAATSNHMINYPALTSQPNDTNSINKTQETDLSLDKTDKALCEIKDILQSFLQEIKKEASSHSDKSDISPNIIEDNLNKYVQSSPPVNPLTPMNISLPVNTTLSVNTPSPVATPLPVTTPLPVNSILSANSSLPVNTPLGANSFNYNMPPCPVPQTPYMPSFAANACCYPMLPIYPLMANGCAVSSSSHTCTCSNRPELDQSNDPSINANKVNDALVSDTDELIKEIYKFVAQSPTFTRNQDDKTAQQDIDEHKLTSRSAGGSTQFRRLDANVGTPDLKCYSKSCDAIGPRMVSNSFCSGTSYSETGLETFNLDSTESPSTNTTTTTTTTTTNTSATTTQSATTHEQYSAENVQQMRKNKLTNMLKSFSLFKKRKKDIIEELSETGSINNDLVNDSGNHMQQNFTNYPMYGQDYYAPPSPPPHPPPTQYMSVSARSERSPPYNPAMHELVPPASAPDHYQSTDLPRQSSEPYYPRHQPTAPPYIPAPYPQYNPMPHPQPPFCLKEIEVKSTGTQSEKKISFFQKIKKTAPPAKNINNKAPITISTQTQQGKNKTSIFSNWKSLQGNSLVDTDPLSYSYNTQKKLAEGDTKLRNSLLNKMLRNKNPFSPKHLLVKTLLGKENKRDQLPLYFKPRMF